MIWNPLIWLVFTHIPKQDCAEITNELFHCKSPRFHLARMEFLTDNDVCAKSLASLRQALPPPLCNGLLTLSVILHKRYLSRGTSFGDMSTYSPIYGLFRNILQAIAASVPRGTVQLERPPLPKVGVRSGYAPRTGTLREKIEAPEDNMLAPHKAASLKRARGVSDADRVGDQLRAEKRPARG